MLFATRHLSRQVLHRSFTSSTLKMSKNSNKKSSLPDESFLLLPHPSPNKASQIPWFSDTDIVDTHTHLLLTFQNYRRNYPNGVHKTIAEFVRNVYAGRNVHSIVDVWCEAPVLNSQWRELADTAFDGLNYNFVLGVHPYVISLFFPDCIG